MKSAWAGALGHPQFMPSVFLKYAIDFDGDGRKDIWNSVPDALASIANFLAQNGWRKGLGWGREIILPASVPCTLEGPDQPFITLDWMKNGVRRMDGRPFPARERHRPAFLLLPAGRYGPAFLVSKNFYVLKKYNESDVYALLIGHVADMIAARSADKGKGAIRAGFRGKWRKIDSFSRLDVRRAQLRLEKRGRDVGGADGLIGFRTRREIGKWQAARYGGARPPTCYPGRRELMEIR
jgi:hypothetical protein